MNSFINDPSHFSILFGKMFKHTFDCFNLFCFIVVYYARIN